MKYLNFVALLFFLLILNNCSRSEGTNNNIANGSCDNVVDFQIVQNGNFLNFTITSTLSGPYEIAFGKTQNSTPTQSFIVNEKTFSKNINDFDGLILEAGVSYTFQIRRICSPTSNSSWRFQKNITLSNNFCKLPYDLKIENLYNKFSWSVDNYSNGIKPSFFQIQYGVQGFSLGSGTIVDSNFNYYYAPLIADKKYDFYVRSFCSGSSGWGDWAGPLTVLSSETTACVAPTYVNCEIINAGTSYFGAKLTWENDGISDYQVSISTSRSIPSSSSLTVVRAQNSVYFTALSKWDNYHYFYVRKVCSGNTFSEYFGPYLVKWN